MDDSCLVYISYSLQDLPEEEKSDVWLAHFLLLIKCHQILARQVLDDGHVKFLLLEQFLELVDILAANNAEDLTLLHDEALGASLVFILLVNDLCREFFLGCCVANVKNLASMCEYLGEAALADLFDHFVLFFEVQLHRVFAQHCPAIIPESSIGKEEIALLAAVTQEEQVPVALETQPLHVYVLERTVAPVFFIRLALEVKEMPLREADVAGGFEAKGASDFNVLVAFSQDFFVWYRGMLAFLDPKEPFLGKSRSREQRRDFVDHFQLVGFLYGKHNSIIMNVTFK